MNRYDLTRESPIIALRRTIFKSAADELLRIWQKKSSDIRDLNSHIQDSWADGDGSIGKAYGYQLSVEHHYKKGDFDQVSRILYNLKHNPLSRRIMSNTYSHHDLYEINLYSCTYGIISNVSGKTPNGILNQCPQDILTANSWGVCQYAVLLHTLVQVSGLKPSELVHVITDACIYDRHIPMVEELLKRESHLGPTLAMDTFIQDFCQFTTDNFRLESYQYYTFDEKIPVAI